MSILNANVPSATSDLVAVFDDSGNQVFQQAIPIKATPDPSLTYMRNPIDQGGQITDHFIINPDLVSVTFAVTNFNYRAVYQQVRELARAAQRFTVQTKSATYSNMYIEGYPAEEDPEKFDSITMELQFIEAQIGVSTLQDLPPAVVANPADASTVNRGEQSTTDTEGSVAFEAIQGVGFNI